MFNGGVPITIFPQTVLACQLWERDKGSRINTGRKLSSVKSGFFPELLCDPIRGRSFIGHYYAHQISNLLNAFSLLAFNRILPIYPHTCAHFFWITFFISPYNFFNLSLQFLKNSETRHRVVFHIVISFDFIRGAH